MDPQDRREEVIAAEIIQEKRNISSQDDRNSDWTLGFKLCKGEKKHLLVF